MSPLRKIRAWIIGSVFVTTSLVALPCFATGGNEAAAEALFGEAKRLVAQGKFAEACEKFAESNRLDRGAGTLIHLADCYEKNKQTASAWATYKEASSAAQAINRADWQKLADKRAGVLEPKLAKLTIRVPEAVEKIDVKRDGALMTQATWGLSIPVDVGSHSVEATAPGFKPFKATVTIARDGERADVLVPKLEALPPTPVAATPTTHPDKTKPGAGTSDDAWKRARAGNSQRTIGILVGGVGVAGVAVGAVAGIVTMGKIKDAERLCPVNGGTNCASREGVDANESSKTTGLISTIGFIAGGVGLAAGAVLYFTAPSGEQPKVGRLQVTPSVGPTGGGLLVGGVF